MRRSIAVLLFVLLFASSKSINAQTESLQSGIPIERMLARGQSHSFTITLEAEQFLQLVVNQRGIDVIIRAFAPDGASLGEFDSPNGGEGPEQVSVVSLEAGVYRFEVTPLNQGENVATGRYEIKVIEQRKATDSELQARKNPELLKARGMALLTDVEDGLQLIRSPLTRIRLQLQIAQILGRSNEKTAAKSAAAAAEGVKEYIAGIDALEEDYYQTYESAMQLRQEVVQVLGQYDVDAALAFLRATRTLATPAQRHNEWDRELYLEMSLASQLTSKDPNRAVQLAEESLKKGFSGGLLDVVARLRVSEPELASKLAKQIAAKLREEKLLKNNEASSLAVNLLRLAHAPVRRFQNSRTAAPVKPPTPLLSEEEYKDLFDKLLAEALAYKGPVGSYSPERNSAQNILNTLKSMNSEMTAYAPSSVSAVEKRVVELNTSGDPNSARWEKYQQQINTGTLEESLQSVAGAPSEMRDQLYQQVAQKAAAAGDLARARQIVKDHIVNPSQRQQALSQIEQQAIYLDASKGKIEEALRGLNNLRNSRERAMIISQIVNQIGPGMKRATAIELLEQSRNLVSSSMRAENQEQMTALVQIAAALSRYDSKRAFEIIEPLIDQFNEMTAAALILNGFGQQYFQDGEVALQNGSNIATMAGMLSQSLGALGRANFDRAKAGADRLQRPELRINAYMAIAQQAIGENVGVRRAGFRRLQ